MRSTEIKNGNSRMDSKRHGSGVGSVPNRGIASETCGRVSATRLRNTVSDRRIVTPVIKHIVNVPTTSFLKFFTVAFQSTTLRLMFWLKMFTVMSIST